MVEQRLIKDLNLAISGYDYSAARKRLARRDINVSLFIIVLTIYLDDF